jgi:hypothetical protein
LKANKLFSKFFTKNNVKEVTTALPGLVLVWASLQSTRHLAKYFVLKNIYRDRSLRAQDFFSAFLRSKACLVNTPRPYFGAEDNELNHQM